MASTPDSPSTSRGLAGVTAGRTAICSLEGTLRYRGYDIADLVAGSFEETAYLLLRGSLPTATELDAFSNRIRKAARSLPPLIPELLARLAKAAPQASTMDALRTAVSALGQLAVDNGPQMPVDQLARETQTTIAEQLIGQVAAALATWVDLTNDRTPASWPEQPLAAALLSRLRGGAISSAEAEAFDTTLILYAEHEFNASTFAARTVTSTGADMHSAVTAAIGALKGPLHGGANEKVLQQLGEIGSLDRVEPWLAEQLAARRVVMGFGHRVYKQGDVRAVLLADVCRGLIRTDGMAESHQQLEQLADRLEGLMLEQKGLKPNLDWPAARVYHALGLPISVFTPIFVVARMSGWTAHVVEQMGDNRLIRPLSEYRGAAPRAYSMLAERST
ncbi:MAG: citrate synthase [Planctomycetia bacterium]|nr:citrate synthase [Planctomycetia bacterium]